MTWVFLFFAVVGGSIMAFQLAMMLLGMGNDAGDVGASDGLGHVDVGDVDVGDLDGTDVDLHDADHPDSTHGFKVLSFRTVVAAATFFGLGGLIGDSAGWDPLSAIGLAVGVGAAALFLVYKLYATLYRMQASGTVQIDSAVGCYGTVYVPIPAEESGPGKALINVQGRTMEYQALTAGPKLATGVRVVVTRVITNDTVEVESAFETPSEAAS